MVGSIIWAAAAPSIPTIPEFLGRNAPEGALVTLITIAVLAVWRGWLVPKRTVDTLTEATKRVEAIQAERLAESVARENEWRAMALAEQARGDLQADQIADLLEFARAWDGRLREIIQRPGGGAS